MNKIQNIKNVDWRVKFDTDWAVHELTPGAKNIYEDKDKRRNQLVFCSDRIYELHNSDNMEFTVDLKSITKTQLEQCLSPDQAIVNMMAWTFIFKSCKDGNDGEETI